MLLSDVSQDSILGPLSFSIYICGMFFEAQSNIAFAGYTDDNTPYTYSSNLQTVLNNLQEKIEKSFGWFSVNYRVANLGKCHQLTSSKTAIDIHISDATISNEKRVKLLTKNKPTINHKIFETNSSLPVK